MSIVDSSTRRLSLEAVCRAIHYIKSSLRIPMCNRISLETAQGVVTWSIFLSLEINYEINFESRTVAIFLTSTLGTSMESLHGSPTKMLF
jgi:hypothetical protein